MRKYFFIFSFLALFIIGAYWFKCQLGINVISGLSWEEHFSVLNFFQKSRYLARAKPGILLAASFEGWFPFMSWIGLWARDQGQVQVSVATDASRSSKCLRVRSSSSHDWSLPHSAAFEVTQGAVFVFEGYARTTGSALAQMSVVTYDEKRRPLQWLFAVENVRSRDWIRVSRRFVVPPGVRYIRFRLTGYGIGEAYFDDIKFVKEK